MTIPVYDSVAYLASDRFAVFNAAGDSFASEFAPGARLRADCGTDGVLLGTVAASGFDAATGRTVVTTAMDGGAALTSNLAAVLHGNDLPASLCAHAALHALGGRDALPGATTGVSGLVSLASTAETQAGTSATKAVTPAGLAASAKGLIATNMTIYVATTGSDTTGTGASGAPYATIARALSSIAGKLIASGATVTIQVADGTYTINSPIVIDHPDADKIQILGNTSAETTVAISSFDPTAKTFTVAGNYVSNAEATKNIVVDDIIGLTGSSANELDGAYIVSGVNYDGSNTTITCSTETFPSSTAGEFSIAIKPCNICRLVFLPGIFAIMSQSPKPLKRFSGFHITGSTIAYALFSNNAGALKAENCIFYGWASAGYVEQESIAELRNCIIKSCTRAVLGYQSTANLYDGCIVDTCDFGLIADRGSNFGNYFSALRNVSTPFSPDANVSGNSNSFIFSV